MSINFNGDPEEAKKRAKNMRISAHVNITNPEKMGYPYLESIRSFADFCEEVIVVDGGSTDGSLEKLAKEPKVRVIQGNKWEHDFDWTILAKNLQIGYENCSSDWAFKFDADYIFHEKWVDKLKEALAKCDLPALEIRKCNYVTVDRYFRKDYYPLLVYKKRYPSVCYGIGRSAGGPQGASFMWPIARNNTRKDGIHLGEFVKMSNVRITRSDVEVYCYDFTFMNKEQVLDQRVRFENALQRFLGRENYRASENKMFNLFISTMRHRSGLCNKDGVTDLKLEDHSKFIRKKVEKIKPEQFGCNMWKE